ncbi:MAG: nucleoside-diphosphate sugar epimerase/dehydratase [Syntrophobacteraceae bacterium]|nr:nucleoside-diphosphate sugar epimerase/dehydratase [Syntrophobacteraceae bacterium]
MTCQFKNPRFYYMLMADSAFFLAALAGAYYLRFEFHVTGDHLRHMLELASVMVPAQAVVFGMYGLYRGMWRYTSIVDFWRLAQACLISMLLAFAYVALFGFQGFSRSVLILYGLLTFLFTGALRMAIRSFYIMRVNPRGFKAYGLPDVRAWLKGSRRVIIIGAGAGGEKILREIIENPQLDFCVAGFIDDDPVKRGRTVHGVPVFGNSSRLSEVIGEYKIDEVFICIPSASGAELRKISEVCKSCGVAFKTLPGIGEIVDGTVSIKKLRDVDYADLLRREPVKLDMAGIKDYLVGKTVLVTGCGGSIGSELCRQLVRFSPGKLVLFDASEEKLFNIERELRELGHDNCECVLGPVQRRELTRDAFSRFRPQVVFHAAAYKHVPMLESNCRIAIYNNVLGSRVVMEAAVEFGVRQFVLVSTDKAVRPTSVMGATKRISELIMQSLRGQGTVFKAVRFGNVVGSSGSVIPVFRRQIERGGPVTVTHPDITRYFMTIPEASQLIIQTGALAEEGDIYILEMGTPVKIREMARDLIRLSGKEPETEIEIEFTGLRPGEKLHEELVTHDEDVIRTRHEKILVVRSNGITDKAENRQHFRENLKLQIDDLFRMVGSQDAVAIRRKLKEIIPEYCPEPLEP